MQFAMPHLAINCERLVPKCARRFWTNAHEFDEAEYKLNDRSCLTYISSDMQEDFLTWSCERYYRTDGGSYLHPHTLCRTCKRNFLQNHASTVTEQTEDLIFIRIHLVGPARGTSYRITPALLLNGRSISSSSTYIASDLQEEFLQNHASTVTEQTEYLIFIHIHCVGPARGTSRRITLAQLLNRRRISSSSTYILLDLQEELLTGSRQHSYWTDGGFHLHPYPSNGLSDNFPGFMNHDLDIVRWYN